MFTDPAFVIPIVYILFFTAALLVPQTRTALFRWLREIYQILFRTYLVLHSGKHECWDIHHALENEIWYLQNCEDRLFDNVSEDYLEHVRNCRWDKEKNKKLVIEAVQTQKVIRSNKIQEASRKKEEERRALERQRIARYIKKEGEMTFAELARYQKSRYYK